MDTVGRTRYDLMTHVYHAVFDGNASLIASIIILIVVLFIGLIIFRKILKSNDFFHQTQMSCILANHMLKDSPEELKHFKEIEIDETPKRLRPQIEKLFPI
jgi:hypothetical protein